MTIVSRVPIVTALVVALLANGLGCARTDWIDRTLVTENVTGVWAGSMGTSTSYRDMRLELQHEGGKVVGIVRFFPGGYSESVEGSMAGDLFTFKAARGGFSGELTVGGDEMTGRVSGPGGTGQASLRRGNPPSQPNPPPR